MTKPYEIIEEEDGQLAFDTTEGKLKTYVITRDFGQADEIRNVADLTYDVEGSSYILVGIDDEPLAVIPLGTFDMIHEKEATE